MFWREYRLIHSAAYPSTCAYRHEPASNKTASTWDNMGRWSQAAYENDLLCKVKALFQDSMGQIVRDSQVTSLDDICR